VPLVDKNISLLRLSKDKLFSNLETVFEGWVYNSSILSPFSKFIIIILFFSSERNNLLSKIFKFDLKGKR